MDIPEKTFFKIGEVAKLLDVEAYVLRYWESEFDMLVPEKTKSGQRIYQQEDIVLLAKIRELLYSEMYTIAGARRQLELWKHDRQSPEIEPREVKQAVVADEAQQSELLRIEAEHAALQQAHEELKAAHERLQADFRALHDAERVRKSEQRDVHAQLLVEYELVCDERDVLNAQLAALQLENESLHLSLTPAEAPADAEESNAELFEVIARLEEELRNAHHLNDQLREAHRQQISQEEERRRDVLRAMRRELEGLVSLAG